MTFSTTISLIKSDFDANRGFIKSFFILFLFRLAHYFYSAPIYLKPISIAYKIFYKITVDVIMGVDMPPACQIGPRAHIFHGVGLVLHPLVRIGSDVILLHGVTIGGKDGPHVPTLGDHVTVGAAAIMIGDIKIGDWTTIGAGAVVVKDVPAKAVVVGNPARIVRMRTDVP